MKLISGDKLYGLVYLLLTVSHLSTEHNPMKCNLFSVYLILYNNMSDIGL
jgi:hypothetical protein